MRRRDADHSTRVSRKRHTRRWIAGLSALVLVGGGAALWATPQGQQWWADYTRDTTAGPSPAPQDPADVAPPAQLALPAPAPATPVAVGVDADQAPRLDPAKVSAALKPVLAEKKMGPRVVLEVSDLAGGPPVFRSGPGRFTPASTTKILTAVAALQAMDPGTTFDTTVVLQPATPGQTGARRIVLVGGGDPYLASSPQAEATVPHRSDLATLAAATATELKAQGITRVRLDRDTSLFTGPSDNPRWQSDYVPDGVVTPIVSLWADRGHDPDGYGRVADPAAQATEVFAAALRQHGLTVRAGQETAAAPRAEEVARVASAPLSEIVEHVLQVSDNEGAEVLSHQVGLAVNGTGSFKAGVAGTRKMLTDLGVDLTGWTQFDGSGLSRHNLFAPQTLTDALRVASSREHPQLRSAITGLPIAGFNGSLSSRFVQTDPQALGMVRAKTGTLTGVHGLSGLVTDASGAVLVYVVVADRVPVADTLDARLGLEQVSAALAACRCAAS